MSEPKWQEMPEYVPTHAQIVWCRIKYYYSTAFLATWDSSLQQFTSVTNNIIYPAWTVSRWKSQT